MQNSRVNNQMLNNSFLLAFCWNHGSRRRGLLGNFWHFKRQRVHVYFETMYCFISINLERYRGHLHNELLLMQHPDRRIMEPPSCTR